MSRNNNPKVHVSWKEMKRECLLHLFCCLCCEVQGLKLKAVRKSCGMKGSGISGKYGWWCHCGPEWLFLRTHWQETECRWAHPSARECMDSPRQSCAKETVEYGGFALQKTCLRFFFFFFFNHILKPPLKLNEDRMSDMVWKWSPASEWLEWQGAAIFKSMNPSTAELPCCCATHCLIVKCVHRFYLIIFMFCSDAELMQTQVIWLDPILLMSTNSNKQMNQLRM